MRSRYEYGSSGKISVSQPGAVWRRGWYRALCTAGEQTEGPARRLVWGVAQFTDTWALRQHRQATSARMTVAELSVAGWCAVARFADVGCAVGGDVGPWGLHLSLQEWA